MRVLIRPVITEKSMQHVADSKYTFKVVGTANKPEITKVIKAMYKVEIIKVNIIKMKPQERLVRGRDKATDKAAKYAIVTVKKGQKIEGFEVKE